MKESLRLRMTRVMRLGALRQEPLATTLAASRESRASTFCAHPGAKTVLTFARPF